MAGIQIIAKNKDGIVKHDYELSRDKNGKTVKLNEMKGQLEPIEPIIHKKINTEEKWKTSKSKK